MHKWQRVLYHWYDGSPLQNGSRVESHQLHYFMSYILASPMHLVKNFVNCLYIYVGSMKHPWSNVLLHSVSVNSPLSSRQDMCSMIYFLYYRSLQRMNKT